MTPEEKIEALREWANQPVTDGAQLASLNWYRDAQRQVRDIIDPPRAKWREDVDERLGWAAELPSPLGSTLRELADLEYGKVDSYADPTTVCLARIIAICEQEVGDGWQADPERVHPGFWGVAWLLVPLSHEPPDWAVVGDRAAAWLRSLTDGGAA